MPRYNFTWFNWLLNVGAWDFLKPTNELASCKNVQEDEVWILKKVPWYTKATAWQVASTSGNVTYLSQYYQPSTNTLRMLAGVVSWSNLVLNYRTTAWWSNLTTLTWDWAKLISSVNYLDRTFIAGWAISSSSFITPATVLWTTYATTDWTNLTSMPMGRYLVKHNDLLYVLYAYESGTLYPSRAYFCWNPTAWAITWTPATDFLEFGQDDWDEITGWASSNNKLVVFKQNSMWTWDESNKRQVADIGCDSHRSIQQVNWILYWFNRLWIWRWDWGIPQLISQKVQKFIDWINVSSFTDVIATKDWLEYRLFIWDVTVNGYTYTNTWIVFDARREKFYIRCTYHPVKSVCEYTEAMNRRSYFGGNSWYVYKQSKYVDNIFADDWNEIDWFFETNALDFTIPHIIKHVPHVHIYTKNNAWMVCAIDADKKWTFDAWRFQINNSNVSSNDIDVSAYRYWFKFLWKDASKPFEFEGFVVETNEKEDL